VYRSDNYSNWPNSRNSGCFTDSQDLRGAPVRTVHARRMEVAAGADKNQRALIIIRGSRREHVIEKVGAGEGSGNLLKEERRLRQIESNREIICSRVGVAYCG
jgi:hypothetical protein